MSALPGWAGAALVYLGLGMAAALVVVRNGHGLPAALTAVPCWPLLLSLLSARGEPPTESPEECAGHSGDVSPGALR